MSGDRNYAEFNARVWFANQDILDQTPEERKRNCKRILDAGRYKLSNVFQHRENNATVAQLVVGKNYLSSQEAERILNPFSTGYNSTPREWSTEFVSLIYNSFHIAECITLLCNLDNSLESYRSEIQNIFRNIKIDGISVTIAQRQNIDEDNIFEELITVTVNDNILNENNIARNRYETEQQGRKLTYFEKMTSGIICCACAWLVILTAFIGVKGYPDFGDKINLSFTKHSNKLASNTGSTAASFPNILSPPLTTTTISLILPINATKDLNDAIPGNQTRPNPYDSAKNEPVALEKDAKTKDTTEKKPKTLHVTTSHQEDATSPKSLTANYTEITYSRQRIFISNVNQIHSQEIVEKICNPAFETSLVVTIKDPYEWKGGVHISCAKLIHSLKIQGIPSIQILHDILNQTENISRLTIVGNDLCLRNSGLWGSFEALSTVRLRRLESLRLESFTDKESNCREILTFLVEKVAYSKLNSLIIDSALFTLKNGIEFDKMLVKASSLRELKMLNVELQTAIFDIAFPSNLTAFHFYVNNPTDEFAARSINNSLVKAKTIREYQSNVEISDEKMSLVLESLSRITVRYLNLTIRLRESRGGLSLKFLRRKLRKLKHCDLRLIRTINSSRPFVITDFDTLSSKLEKFRLSANFKFNERGASNLACRGYDKETDSKGITFITVDRCPNCILSGCKRR